MLWFFDAMACVKRIYCNQCVCQNNFSITAYSFLPFRVAYWERIGCNSFFKSKIIIIYLVMNSREQTGMDRTDRIRKKQTGTDRNRQDYILHHNYCMHHKEIHISDRKSRSKGKPHCVWDLTKKGQWALHVYSIATLWKKLVMV